MGKATGQNISKELSSKYSQKPIDNATDALKTDSERAI